MGAFETGHSALLPQIAISLYVTLDRTMLGALASYKGCGDLRPGLEIGQYFADPCDVFRKCHASARGESLGFKETTRLLIKCTKCPF